MPDAPSPETAKLEEDATYDHLARAIQHAIMKRDPDAGSGCWLDVLPELRAYGYACWRSGRSYEVEHRVKQGGARW